MSVLDSIPVIVNGSSFEGARGNARPILHEIRHALNKLLDTGEETIVDLYSLPMAPADEQELREALGTGEIEVRLDAFGTSTIRETSFPGVWLVEHFDPEQRPIAKFIEVTLIPSIVKSDPADVRDGLVRLANGLSEDQEPPQAAADSVGDNHSGGI